MKSSRRTISSFYIPSVFLAAMLSWNPANAQEQEGALNLIENSGFRLNAGIEAGIQGVGQSNPFWNLAEVFAPMADFDTTPFWGEGYLKPYLTFNSTLKDTSFYGKLSAIASATMGTDVFDETGESAITLEDAYVGIRVNGFDLSVGSQPYKLGTGMLLSDGGGDGFERGALIFGPRAAWEMTAIGRLTLGETRLEGFYLDPRELEFSDTYTTIVGASATHNFSQGRTLGIAGGRVLESAALWIQAAPGGNGVPSFIPDGREGMSFLTAWGKWAVSDRFTLATDVAFEANDKHDMAAWAARVQAIYAAPNLPFSPVFGYSYQTFSGDDPNTTELERFDPLFYDGSPAGWGSGANASLVFLNSNVAAHQLWVATTVTPQDFLTFRYYHVRANELFSPLQFGQGTRLDPTSLTVISGVTDSHLSDDIYAEYTRVLSANAFLTGGVGISFPGRGMIDQGGDDIWTGGYLNLVLRY